jgi:hypothetical protein
MIFDLVYPALGTPVMDVRGEGHGVQIACGGIDI